MMMADLSKPMSFDEFAVEFVGVCHFVLLKKTVGDGMGEY
jgi:hypothetical protein